MNRKFKFALVPAICGLLSLTACNNTNTTNVTVNVWTGFGTSMTTAFENSLSAYKDLHAEDYKGEKATHEIVHTGQGGYDNLLAAIVGSVSTRTYPQLAVAYPDHMAQYNESGILFDLTASLETQGIELDKYYQNYLKECQEIVEGKVMGLPFNKSTEVLTTNTTFVETLIKMTASKEGADKITGVPATWQEVETFGLATLKVLKETGAFNKVIGEDGKVYTDTLSAAEAGVNVAIDLTKVGENDFRVLSYDSQANFFITAVRQWGGTYTALETVNGKSKGVMHYKSNETVEMLKFFNRLFREGLIGIPATFGESSYTSTPFKNYKTIFTIGSSAGVSNCVPDGNAFKVDVNPIPYNAEKPDCKYVISQGTNLVMFKNPDEASRNETLELLTYLSYNGEANATFAKTSGYLPVTKEAFESTIYQDYMKDETLEGTSRLMRDAAKLNFDQYNGESANWVQYVDPGFVGSSSIRSNVQGIMAECGDVKESDANNTDFWLNMLDKYYQMNKNNMPN